MQFAVVRINLLDMWKLPKYNSERVNQALFGNPLKILKSRNGFVLVSQPDGYTGWVDERFIVLTGEKYFHSFEKQCRYVVSQATARVYDKLGRPTDPYLLYYGTRVSVSKYGLDFVKCQIPSIAGKYLKRSVLTPILSKKKRMVEIVRLKREAAKFLGCPYLWGGVTPAGFDCSSFVRALFGRFGIYLPRDTKDQIREGTEIKREDIKSGDLVFFERHVAMAIDNLRYIHCSAGGGGVRINSFDVNSDDYRSDLNDDFKQARRIL